jgi:hypothetical protein
MLAGLHPTTADTAYPDNDWPGVDAEASPVAGRLPRTVRRWSIACPSRSCRGGTPKTYRADTITTLVVKAAKAGESSTRLP